MVGVLNVRGQVHHRTALEPVGDGGSLAHGDVRHIAGLDGGGDGIFQVAHFALGLAIHGDAHFLADAVVECVHDLVEGLLHVLLDDAVPEGDGDGFRQFHFHIFSGSVALVVSGRGGLFTAGRKGQHHAEGEQNAKPFFHVLPPKVFSFVLAMRNCICHVFQGKITPSYHRMQRLP